MGKTVSSEPDFFFYRPALIKGFVNIIFKLLKGSDNDRRLTLPVWIIQFFFVRKNVIY